MLDLQRDSPGRRSERYSAGEFVVGPPGSVCRCPDFTELEMNGTYLPARTKLDCGSSR